MKYILHERGLDNFSSPAPPANARISQHRRRSCGRAAFGCCARLGRLCNDGNRSRRRQREPGGDWQQRFARGESQFGENRIRRRQDGRRGPAIGGFLFRRIITANGRRRGRRRGFIRASLGMHRVNTWGEKLQRRSLSGVVLHLLRGARTGKKKKNCPRATPLKLRQFDSPYVRVCCSMKRPGEN